MGMKRVLVSTTDFRKYTSEILRLGSLGAIFTDQCIAIKGVPLCRATVLVEEDVDVGSSPILTVFGAEEVQSKEQPESKVEEPVAPVKAARAPNKTAKQKAE